MDLDEEEALDAVWALAFGECPLPGPILASVEEVYPDVVTSSAVLVRRHRGLTSHPSMPEYRRLLGTHPTLPR